MKTVDRLETYMRMTPEQSRGELKRLHELELWANRDPNNRELQALVRTAMNDGTDAADINAELNAALGDGGKGLSPAERRLCERLGISHLQYSKEEVR